MPTPHYTRYHRKYRSEQLNRHIQIFDDVALDDMDQLASQYKVDTIDTTNIDSTFSLLRSSLADSPSFPYLQSLVYHLLLVPGCRCIRFLNYSICHVCMIAVLIVVVVMI